MGVPSGMKAIAFRYFGLYAKGQIACSGPCGPYAPCSNLPFRGCYLDCAGSAITGFQAMYKECWPRYESEFDQGLVNIVMCLWIKMWAYTCWLVKTYPVLHIPCQDSSSTLVMSPSW